MTCHPHHLPTVLPCLCTSLNRTFTTSRTAYNVSWDPTHSISVTGLAKCSQPHPPLSRPWTCQTLSHAALCSLPVPALCGRDSRAPSRAPAVCQAAGSKAWDPAWVHSHLSVDRPVSFLCQAHRRIPSREAAPWYPAAGYLNGGLHPVTSVACYSCGPPGAISRQLLLQEAALGQGVDIFMPSHRLSSSYSLQESGYLESVGIWSYIHVSSPSLTWGRRGCWEMLLWPDQVLLCSSGVWKLLRWWVVMGTEGFLDGTHL